MRYARTVQACTGSTAHCNGVAAVNAASDCWRCMERQVDLVQKTLQVTLQVTALLSEEAQKLAGMTQPYEPLLQPH